MVTDEDSEGEFGGFGGGPPPLYPPAPPSSPTESPVNDGAGGDLEPQVLDLVAVIRASPQTPPPEPQTARFKSHVVKLQHFARRFGQFSKFWRLLEGRSILQISGVRADEIDEWVADEQAIELELKPPQSAVHCGSAHETHCGSYTSCEALSRKELPPHKHRSMPRLMSDAA